MARCESCGNDYDKSFQVILDGKTHVFDSFECAIHALAPTCSHCGCSIIGHGAEADGVLYCSAHCARKSGVTRVSDRVETAGSLR
jgi:nitrite reductase/ring-hydroxylating ferredoxin subunit